MNDKTETLMLIAFIVASVLVILNELIQYFSAAHEVLALSGGY